MWLLQGTPEWHTGAGRSRDGRTDRESVGMSRARSRVGTTNGLHPNGG